MGENACAEKITSGLESIANDSSMITSTRRKLISLKRGTYRSESIYETDDDSNQKFEKVAPIKADLVRGKILEYDSATGYAWVGFPSSYKFTNANISILPGYQSSDLVGREIKVIIGFHDNFDRVIRAKNLEKRVISNDFPDVKYNVTSFYP